MKVKIKSVLKTTHHQVESFDDQQIITRSGNTLSIKEIGKNQCQFICLHPNLSHLFAFKPATNRKGVFTAQRVDKTVYIAHYNLRGDRKAISLSDESAFFMDVESIQLLVDECDNSIVYGGARNKEGACIFLGDINKGKLLATGFMASYEDIKVSAMENLTLSVCYNNGSTNYLRHLKYALGQWEVTEQAFKKIQNGFAIMHLILPLNRMVFATKNCLYHFEDTELIQTIEMQKGEKIRQILKIAKGLIIVGERNTVQILIEDSDQVTLVNKGLLKLQLESQDEISKVLLSLNNQQVIVRTIKNNIYIWKCQHIDLDPTHSDFKFVKVESSCASSQKGSISISTGKKYCLLSGTRNVTLWNIEKNQFVLSSQFISNLEAEKKKSILSCAINPDGNSFMIAFEDRIRVYKILLTKFKLYAEFPIKKCSNILYSHGGQLAACRYGKGINSSIAIINNLRLVEVGTLKIQAEPIQIVWNELDDQIIIVTDMNSIQMYSIADSTRNISLKFDSPVKYARIDYKMRKIMVSSQKKISIVSNGEIVQQYTPPFADFHYIFPLYDTYFITTYSGMLYWSSSYKFQQYNSYSLFIQSPFHLLCRNSYLMAYSSFEEVMILQCIRPGTHPKKSSNDDIVMVEKDEIIQFYEKIKMLQASFDMLQSSTQIKLEQEKNNYDAALRQFKKQFSQEIGALSKNFNEMTHTKIKQEKETELTFEAVQAGQLRNVQQIQTMYERKCAIIQQKFLNLQQSTLQQKNMYENLLADLQAKYHKEVSAIRSNYEKKIKEQSMKAAEAKKNILEDKKKMQFKLFQLQQQNQYALQNIQQNKDSKIAKLTQNISSLQTQLEQVQIKNQTTIAQFERLQQQSADARKSYQLLSIKYQQSLNRIKMLQKQIESKNEMIEQRNQIITELNHQVGGLQKAKYVLSLRTTEIRKELEPKEALADRLKSELSKLDQEFKQTKKKNFQLSQRIEKINKINETLKKENAEMRMALKLKDRIHSELCFEIFNIINTMDPKEWNEHFIKIYKAFIKEQKFKSKQNRKKDDTSQELNRHLMHVELSLQQVATSNDKILRGKEKDITRRMEQNSKLLFEINVMKQKEKQMSKIHNELALNNEKLQKELDESYKTTRRSSTRAQTSNTGITRRAVVSRDALYSREKSMLIDRVDNSKEKDLREMLKERSRVGSAHKTLMYRDDKRQKSAKFFDMAKQLQTAQNTIKVQEQMLQQLNQRLFGIDENSLS